MWIQFKKFLKFFLALLGPAMIMVAIVVGGPLLIVEAQEYGHTFVLVIFGGLILLSLFVLSWGIALIDFLIQKQLNNKNE